MDGLLRCSTIPQARPGVVCVDKGGQPALTDLEMQALPKLEIGDSEIAFKYKKSNLTRENSFKEI